MHTEDRAMPPARGPAARPAVIDPLADRTIKGTPRRMQRHDEVLRVYDPSDGQGGPVRLVICDTNRIFSEALAAALENFGCEVLSTTASADDVIAAVVRQRPDVCVLDLHLPEPQNGLKAVRELRSCCPDTAVLVVSDIQDPSVWSQLKRLGVSGHLGKDRSVCQIADALRVIVSGRRVFDAAPPRQAPRRRTPVVLTPREAELVRRIVAGQGTRQMAREMNISISTLRTYVKNVLAKLGAHSRLEAAAVATRLNLTAIDAASSSPPRHEP
jgi:two-component system, NarL family, nitrate/nitrite response regulator NarL